MTNDHEGKFKGQSPCPKCSSICETQTWQKQGKVYQVLICKHCRAEFGKVTYPGSSGVWHEIGDYNQRAQSK